MCGRRPAEQDQEIRLTGIPGIRTELYSSSFYAEFVLSSGPVKCDACCFWPRNTFTQNVAVCFENNWPCCFICSILESTKLYGNDQKVQANEADTKWLPDLKLYKGATQASLYNFTHPRYSIQNPSCTVLTQTQECTKSTQPGKFWFRPCRSTKKKHNRGISWPIFD